MEDTGRRVVVVGGSVRDIEEEECYLRIEPLSCEWSKKTARFSPCSSLLSMGLFSPLFPFFLSILLSSDSFLSYFFSLFSFLLYNSRRTIPTRRLVRCPRASWAIALQSIDELVGSKSGGYWC